jgi:hypothetical protein
MTTHTHYFLLKGARVSDALRVSRPSADSCGDAWRRRPHEWTASALILPSPRDRLHPRPPLPLANLAAEPRQPHPRSRHQRSPSLDPWRRPHPPPANLAAAPRPPSGHPCSPATITSAPKPPNFARSPRDGHPSRRSPPPTIAFPPAYPVHPDVVVAQVSSCLAESRAPLLSPCRAAARWRTSKGNAMSRLLVPRGKMKLKAAEVNREGRPCWSRPLGRKFE